MAKPVITKAQLLDRMEGVARRSNKADIAHILAEIADDVMDVITVERRHELTRCLDAAHRAVRDAVAAERVAVLREERDRLAARVAELEAAHHPAASATNSP